MLSTDPIDILLNASGDLDLSNGKDLQLSAGQTGVAQAIRIGVQFVMGEWFADLDKGVAYFEKIWGQKFDEPVVLTEFRKAILAAPGVGRLDSITATFNNATRVLTVTWVAITEFGDTVSDSLSLAA